MFAWLRNLFGGTNGTPATQPSGDDAAGAAPGEALADRVEEPHAPTTPDNPLETVELDED